MAFISAFGLFYCLSHVLWERIGVTITNAQRCNATCVSSPGLRPTSPQGEVSFHRGGELADPSTGPTGR
jgi:hypothetical protein